MIHGLPGDEFLGEYIHPAKQRQLHEKLHKIQVSKNQRAGFFHLVANPLQMARHLCPVQARAVVMAEVIPLVHEVHFINDGHGMREIIFGIFRVAEGVLHPGGDGHNEVHGEKWN